MFTIAVDRQRVKEIRKAKKVDELSLKQKKQLALDFYEMMYDYNLDKISDLINLIIVANKFVEFFDTIDKVIEKSNGFVVYYGKTLEQMINDKIIKIIDDGYLDDLYELRTKTENLFRVYEIFFDSNFFSRYTDRLFKEDTIEEYERIRSTMKEKSKINFKLEKCPPFHLKVDKNRDSFNFSKDFDRSRFIMNVLEYSFYFGYPKIAEHVLEMLKEKCEQTRAFDGVDIDIDKSFKLIINGLHNKQEQLLRIIYLYYFNYFDPYVSVKTILYNDCGYALKFYKYEAANFIAKKYKEEFSATYSYEEIKNIDCKRLQNIDIIHIEKDDLKFIEDVDIFAYYFEKFTRSKAEVFTSLIDIDDETAREQKVQEIMIILKRNILQDILKSYFEIAYNTGDDFKDRDSYHRYKKVFVYCLELVGYTVDDYKLAIYKNCYYLPYYVLYKLYPHIRDMIVLSNETEAVHEFIMFLYENDRERLEDYIRCEYNEHNKNVIEDDFSPFLAISQEGKQDEMLNRVKQQMK